MIIIEDKWKRTLINFENEFTVHIAREQHGFVLGTGADLKKIIIIIIIITIQEIKGDVLDRNGGRKAKVKKWIMMKSVKIFQKSFYFWKSY